MNDFLDALMAALREEDDFENPELRADDTILVSSEGNYFAITVEQF